MDREKADRRFRWCAEHLEHYAGRRGRLPERVLELGTGWIPAVPLGMALCGVDSVLTIDIQDLKRRRIFGELLALVRSYSFEDLARVLPRASPDRFEALLRNEGDVFTVFRDLGIRFLVGDAARTDLADGSIDLFVSNTTLEHIPGPVLEGIWREFRRLIASDGLMSHLIDMGDHYAHFDASISPHHFLKHRPWKWRLVNNALLYQNRLRVSDYRRLHEENGFCLLEEKNQMSPAAPDPSDLSPEFRHYTIGDLAPVVSWMVAEAR